MNEWRFWWEAARCRWGRLLLIVGVCTAIGVAVALVLPPRYTARADLLPPEESGRALPLLSQLGGLAGLENAGAAGSIGALYPDIARSRGVLEAALQTEWEGRRFALRLTRRPALGELEEERLLEDVQRQLTGHVNPVTGLITLEFAAHDRRLAAAFLVEVLRQMEDFFANRMTSEAREKRLSIEARLAELAESQARNEGTLREFLETNRVTAMSPGLQLREAALRREVEVGAALYSELRRQHELARIEEVGTTPVLRQLSPPVPPHRRTSPRRVVIAGAALFLGLMVAGAWLRAVAGRRT